MRTEIIFEKKDIEKAFNQEIKINEIPIDIYDDVAQRYSEVGRTRLIYIDGMVIGFVPTEWDGVYITNHFKPNSKDLKGFCEWLNKNDVPYTTTTL